MLAMKTNETEPVARLSEKECSNLAFMRTEFSMPIDWGVRDAGFKIHSMGCNYLAAFGRHAGLLAINEYSLFIESGQAIRPDTIGWEQETRMPVFLTEFERYATPRLALNERSWVAYRILARKACADALHGSTQVDAKYVIGTKPADETFNTCTYSPSDGMPLDGSRIST
jgi:hypothetical protein